MAIGGFHNKGHIGGHNYGINGGNNSNSNNSRTSSTSSGRSYGMMIMLAFGAALLGVMVLHKLRERRIYNLIVQQKDRDFYSLHLLLQKERDYSQEAKIKNEEMKAKIYTLRTQKMELDRRLLEMQSTIDSLKDELRTMETAFEEKQKENKMLRVQQDQMGNNEKESNNPQVVALIESLKQKEAEIEALKRHLEYPEKVWSVSSDDTSSSNVPVNVTVAGQNVKSDEDGEKRVDPDPDENGNEVRNGDRREMIGKRIEKFEKVQHQNVNDDGFSGGGENVKSEDAKDDTSTSVSEENSVANSTDVISYNGRKDIHNEGQLEKPEDRRGEGEEDPETAKGGMKLEVRDGSENGVWSTARGKRGFVSNSRGKRWRFIAKNRRLENNGRTNVVAGKRSVGLHEVRRDWFKNRVMRATFNRQAPLVSDSNHQLQRKKAESYPDSVRSENSESNAVSYNIVEALDQKAENRKSKAEAAIGIQHDRNRREMNKDRKFDNEESEGLKAADAQESEKREGDNKSDSN